MQVNHSGQIHARNNNTITKNTSFNIYCVTSLLVFSSFLDFTITGYVTQISGFLRNTEIKLADFFEVAYNFRTF